MLFLYMLYIEHTNDKIEHTNEYIEHTNELQAANFKNKNNLQFSYNNDNFI